MTVRREVDDAGVVMVRVFKEFTHRDVETASARLCKWIDLDELLRRDPSAEDRLAERLERRILRRRFWKDLFRNLNPNRKTHANR